MNNPCPNNVNCPCSDSNPLSGYASETPDVPVFKATEFESLIPPLGTDWKAFACMVVATSTISQADANLIAKAQAQQCAVASWKNPVNGNPNPVTIPPVPPPQGPHGGGDFQGFFNAPQQGTALCPDGTTFTFQVPAGLFFGFSQLIADTEAQTYAEHEAAKNMICLSALSTSSGVLSQPFFATVMATGRTVNQPNAVNSFYIVSGQLPPGLFLTESGSVATISGTPTATGTYPFTIEMIDTTGQSKTNAYSITITGVFATMVWDTPNGNLPGPPTPPDSLNYTANGDTANIAVDARVNGINMTATGTMPYVGAGFRGALIMVVKSPWTAGPDIGPGRANVNVFLQQARIEGSVSLVGPTDVNVNNTGVGTYVFPFTALPTGNGFFNFTVQPFSLPNENFQMNMEFFIQQFSN